jgi:hypothetical protein
MSCSLRWLDAAVLIVAFIVSTAQGAELPDDRPTQTSARTIPQIEADWLRQDVVRKLTSGRAVSMVSAEDDALGACDGLRDGTYGFHTAMQATPWWQVDLLKITALEELLIFNRCDGSQSRAVHLHVLTSDDGKAWKTAYQHDGTMFLGHTDNHPLSVELAGIKARFLRIQLPGETYLHLDEVEIYQPGGRRNKCRNVSPGN